LYSADILSTDDPSRRLPRARQSAAATRLGKGLRDANFIPTTLSKSHSRMAVAAALGDARVSALGIDIEWIAPERRLDAVAAMIFDPVPENLAPLDFYCGWTFYEAYFKAFQRFPPGVSVSDVVAHAPRDGIFRFADGTQVLHRVVAESFLLCIVWEASAPCIPQYKVNRTVLEQRP
jgi:hypothetical protein